VTLGCCCQEGSVGTELYGYTGIPYLISNKRFTEPPGSKLNPIYNNKLEAFKYVYHKGFRYGYEIDGFSEWIAVAAGSTGLSLYKINEVGMPIHSRDYLRSGGNQSNAISTDANLQANTPVHFSDSRGARYGFDGFNGVYGVCVGFYKGSRGFFAACGKKGVYFVNPDDGAVEHIFKSTEQGETALIRRVHYVDEDVFVFGGAGYEKPNFVMGGIFDQIDYFPEYIPNIHGKFNSFSAKSFIYIRGKTHSIAVGSINSIDSKIEILDNSSVKSTSGNIITKETTLSYKNIIYMAGEQGLLKVELKYSKIVKKHSFTSSYTSSGDGGSSLLEDTIEYGKEMDMTQSMVRGGKVYSVAINESGDWVIAIDGRVESETGGSSHQSFVKSFCKDKTPLASGLVAYNYHSKSWFSEAILTDGESESQNLAGSGSFSQNYDGVDDDLVLGAFPVSVRGGVVSRWQAGVGNVNNLETNSCENWGDSTSILRRDGYVNFQYSLSCIDAYSKGGYTYAIDSLQYIANSMGPGWYTPLNPQSLKPMGAAVELYLDRDYGASSAGGGIVVLN
jgi:hypothetical protein